MSPRTTTLLAAVTLVALAAGAFWLARPSQDADAITPSSANPTATAELQPLQGPIEPPHTRSTLGAGHVADRIEGQVFHDGEPIFDAVVACSVCSAPGALTSVTTDRDGAFTIGGLRDGCHQLRITREGYAPTALLAESGTSVRIELQMVRVHGFVEGLVVDDAGAPVDTFAVSIQRARKGGWVSLVNAKPVSGTGGFFREPISLPDRENELSIAISARGFRDVRVSCEKLGASSRVDLGAIVLERFVGGVAGQVVDDRGGAPIADAMVIPVSTGGRTEDEVRTDGTGRFSIDRVSGGDIVGLAVSATDFAPTYVASSEFGDPAHPLVIRLGRGAEVRGTVVSIRSEPLAGLLVGWWLDAGESVLPGLPTLVSSTVPIDASGEYRLLNVPSKPLVVGVVRPGPTRIPPLVEFQHLTAIQCAEAERRTQDFVLGEGVPIRVQLLAAGRGPMTALAAKLVSGDAGPTAVVQCVVGAKITFHDVAPGRYALRVESTPGRSTDFDVVVADTEVDLGSIDVSACFAR